MGKHPDRLDVSLPEEQKEKWKQFVDDTDAYSSISDLVRKSVEKEIGLEDRTQEFGEFKEEIVRIISSVNVKLDTIDNGVNMIRDDLPNDEKLYDVNHDATIDAVDKIIEDAHASSDDYMR